MACLVYCTVMHDEHQKDQFTVNVACKLLF